ncbi:MAG: EutN/CcmL family microcompartment protein [Candidatus Hydrogenedentes bacterium]|nr:EutN/CcmL family microcompartment protein [Candidatus Hydrogenedentota bacterium]
MIPGKVIGRLVPAHVLDSLKSVRFLVVQPVNERLQPAGEPIVVCDAIGANTGEYVYIAQGSEATFPLPIRFNPADMTAIAIIDNTSDLSENKS